MSRLQGLAVLVVGCIVVTGCSTDTEADPTAVTEPTTWTTTSTPTPTGTTTEPEVTEPSLPAAAAKPGAKGAEAFVRYYINLFNYSVNAGQTTKFAARAKGCGPCDRYVHYISSTYGAGGWLKTRGWLPTSVVGTQAGSAYAVAVQIESAPVRYRAESSDSIHESGTEKYSLIYDVERTSDAWIVVDLRKSVV